MYGGWHSALTRKTGAARTNINVAVVPKAVPEGVG